MLDSGQWQLHWSHAGNSLGFAASDTNTHSIFLIKITERVKCQDESGDDCHFPRHRHRSSGEKTEAKTQMGNELIMSFSFTPDCEKNLVHEILTFLHCVVSNVVS